MVPPSAGAAPPSRRRAFPTPGILGLSASCLHSDAALGCHEGEPRVEGGEVCPVALRGEQGAAVRHPQAGVRAELGQLAGGLVR